MRVVVVGGGITGLAAAHRLLELAGEQGRAVEVALLEAGSRLGGIIGTEERDGFLLEAGPDSFITDKPWALDLCRRLGLEEELIGTDPTHRRSFVVKGRRLLPVPEGFQLLAPSRLWPFVFSPLFSWPGKLRMAAEWFLPARQEARDESLAAFVERRLGREALERIAQPMIAGIYGADPRSLSLRATMPRFLEMEQKHGSVIRAMVSRRSGVQAFRRSGSEKAPAGPSSSEPEPLNARTPERLNAGVSGARYGLFVSFLRGMQTLVDVLSARLPEGCVRLATQVSSLSRTDQGWQAVTEGTGGGGVAETLTADAVCLALPAYRSATLLESLDGELAALLNSIPYGRSATVNLAYRRADVRHPLNGFGFVVPAVEKRALLGCTFSSVKFPHRAPEGHVLLRAFLGETGLADRDDETLEAAVRAELDELLGIAAPPLFTRIHRQDRAMAHYTIGHLERVAAIESAVVRFPGLALAGNAYHGIGIPDCVRSGAAAAERMLGDA